MRTLSVLVVSCNEGDFLKLLVESLAKNTDRPHQILVWDNGGDAKEWRGQWDNVTIFDSPRGNIGHGAGMDELIKLVDSEYTLILDSDAHLRMKGWDSALIAFMLEKELDIMPAQGGHLKPIRPAFMLWRTQALKEAGSMQSFKHDGIWFDTGIAAYFRTLTKNPKGVFMLKYMKSPFEGIWGECYGFGNHIFAFHHYYGSRFGKDTQEVDGRKREDFEESKRKLFEMQE